jgi:Tfp pilus assembly protein PilN
MIRINLAPAEVRRRRAAFKLPELRVNLGIIFGVLYLLALGGSAYYWWDLTSQEKHLAEAIDRLTKENDSLKAKIDVGKNVAAQLTEAKRRVQVIEELTKGQARPILLLDAFADSMPRDLWVTGMEERGATLRVTGTAFSTVAVSDFMNNLRASGKFKEVDLIVSRQDLTKSPSLVTFEVTCRFES